MEINHLEEIWKTMEQVVLDAGNSLLDREESTKVHKKGFADFVTEVDLHVQGIISKQLNEKFPSIQFMGEEKDNSDLDFSQAVWILDPVDGTTNLIRDMKMSVISLALAVNREAVAGVIYQPYTRELFSAAKGKGAYVNGTPIKVSDAAQLKSSVIAMGTSPYYHELAEQTFDAAKRIFCASMDIRRSGSAAMDLAYVAAGRLEGMYELILQPWDIAAGKIIIEEAGGKMTRLSGDSVDVTEKGSIMATNSHIHEELKEIIACQ